MKFACIYGWEACSPILPCLFKPWCCHGLGTCLPFSAMNEYMVWNTWFEVRWLHAVSRWEGLPLYPYFTFVVTSSLAHRELFLRQQQWSPTPCHPTHGCPSCFPSHRPPRGLYKSKTTTLCHTILLPSHHPLASPSPKSSCHLALTALSLRCASGLSWADSIYSSNVLPRKSVFSFSIGVRLRGTGNLKLQVILYLPLLPSLNHFI